jgi:hypothetical protein
MQLTTPTPTQSKDLGAKVFAFGFPLLLSTETMRQAIAKSVSGSGAGANAFAHVSRFPDPSFRAIVAANVDTLYSSAWLDLSLGPLLMQLPDAGGRSYLMSMMDAWTGVFASFTRRTLGEGEHTVAIVGPGWSGDLPADTKRVDAPTSCVWAIYHLHGRGPQDLDACRAIQGRLTLIPMSPDAGEAPPQPGDASTLAPLSTAYQRVMGMDAPQFLAALALQMGANPPAPADGPLLEQLATINLRPGKPFEWSDIPGATREGLAAGFKEGKEMVASGATTDATGVGWLVSSPSGEASTDPDYIGRARAASFAWGVSRPADAIFPLSTTDSEGRPLSGGHRYALSFEPGALPPVEAHWSLAMYDLDQLFVKNPPGRYALGDRDELELDSDGTLRILVQHDPPEGPQANWLPAPEDSFYLMLHLYEPRESVLDGAWTAPAIRRLD